MYGLCTKVFKVNIGRITVGIILFERKRRRETTPNVKLISTSFMDGKLYSHGLEVESTPRFRASFTLIAWVGNCRW